jgi:ABC-type transporter Mla subunit MlaD
MKPADRRLNFWLGIGALVLAMAAGLWMAIRPVLKQPSEPPQLYVAYFENAGGLEVGDVVRIKGRRAGRVVGTEVVRRDDKVMIRVEFEIAPGSGSQWLKQGGIPVDSVIRVRQPAVLGRPTLSIELGEADKIIHVGGEWPQARGVTGEDQFSALKAKLNEFDAAIDKYMAYVRPEFIADIKARIAQLRLSIDQARSAVSGAVADVPLLVERVNELGRMLRDLLTQVRKAAPGIEENVKTVEQRLRDAPRQAQDASEAIADLREMVSRIDKTVAEFNGRSEDGDFSKAVREFRKFSAQLRASAVRSEYQPKQAGDLPPWRLARPYFNGGSTALEGANTAEKGGAVEYKELPLPPRARSTSKTQD